MASFPTDAPLSDVISPAPFVAGDEALAEDEATIAPVVEEIPRGIDPVLLYVWHERRRRLEEADAAANEPPPLPPRLRPHRRLSTVYAAYLGVIGMLTAILFGFLRGTEMREVIDTAAMSLFVFTLVGYLLGWIAEFCVRESVVFMLREVVRRGDEALAAEMPPADSL